MDVGSTQRFGTLNTHLPAKDVVSPKMKEQEPHGDDEKVRLAFEKQLMISPNLPPVGERLAGRSQSFKDTSHATSVKIKRASMPAFMPSYEPQKTVFEKSSRRGSLLERLRPSKPEPEMKNGYVENLLKYDEWLLGSTEILFNSCKNFSCINLDVPSGVLVGDFSEELFQSLCLCLPLLSDLGLKPMVQGNEVLEKDRKSLKNFILQITVDEIWTRLFHEMIQRRDDQKKGKIFLSPCVCKALLMMKTQEEIDKVATHLMSECTHIDRFVRLIKMESFCALLADERIASLPVLRRSLIHAADKVMVVAIRSCQHEIAFDALKGDPNRREKAAKWKEKAKDMGSDHLSLDGIEIIAKECAFELNIDENPEDISRQNLQYMLALHRELLTTYGM